MLKKCHLSVMTLAVMLLLGAVASLGAEDGYWVRRCYAWSGNGTVNTGCFRIFGKEFRIRYKTLDNGPLKITVMDGAPVSAVRRQPGKVVLTAKKLPQPGTREVSGYEHPYLLIEGPAAGWIVEIDQYLTHVTEWNWQRFSKKQPKVVQQGAWSGTGEGTVEFEATEVPCQMRFQGDAGATILATNAQGEVLLRSVVPGEKVMVEGWLHRKGPVSFQIGGTEGDWLLEAFTE